MIRMLAVALALHLCACASEPREQIVLGDEESFDGLRVIEHTTARLLPDVAAHRTASFRSC